MALILKRNKTIINPYTGQEFSTAYAVIDHIENNKHNKTQVIRTAIYVNVDDRSSQRSPLTAHELNQEFIAIGSDWDVYFSVIAVSPERKNYYSQSYIWLSTITNERDNLVWGDWESDE